jgi:MFS family permease
MATYMMSDEEKKYTIVLLIVKAFQFLGAAFSGPIYMLYLLSKGLSQSSANNINAVYMGSNSILEPIMGNFADRVGQKKAYLIGLFLWGVAMVAYGLSNVPMEFRICEIIAAIAGSTMSDSLESWVRNKLKKESSDRVLSLSRSKARMIGLPALVVSGFVAHYFGFQANWIISGLFAFTGVIVGIVILLPLGGIQETRIAGRKIIDFTELKQSFGIAVTHPGLKLGLIMDASLPFFFQPLNMYWAPQFAEFGIPVWGMGLFVVAWSFCMAMGDNFFSRWPRLRIGYLIAATGLLVFVGAIVRIPVITIGFFVLHEVTRGIYGAAFFSWFNDHVKDDALRSTFNSVKNSTSNIGSMLGLILWGLPTDWISRLDVWVIVSISIVLLALWVERQMCVIDEKVLQYEEKMSVKLLI